MDDQIRNLVAKYNEGVADPTEIRQLEQWIENGEVPLTALRQLHHLDEQLLFMPMPAPSLQADDRFYNMLAREKRSMRKAGAFRWPDMSQLLPRLAFATLTIILGFTAGFLISRQTESRDMRLLTEEITGLKEMMIVSLLEKESATDRLRAVSLTAEMDRASRKVTGALLQTLNHDIDVNVRLAALEALKPYVHDGKVREELIRSIRNQESPLVQIALAELMVALQEKKSVNELKRILEDERMPPDAKNRIRESIETLI